MQEQGLDIIGWWNEQSFPGKELFRLEESGELILSANNNIKERIVATLSPENRDIILKNLIDKFSSVEARLSEMEVEWLAAEDKAKLADKVASVKDFLNHVDAVGDYLKPALLVHDWEHTIYKLTEETYKAKLELAELAESMADSDQWKETAQAFKDITDRWKQAGAHLDRSRNDKLWNRIEAGRSKFMDRKRAHHEEEEKNMLINLDLKLELVAQAEQLAASEEWKKTTDAFIKLMDEWKKIGHTMSKKNEELWQRFIAAKNAFFDRKKEHSDRIHQDQENNYAAKLVLTEKAEALKESKDWNKTAQLMAGLMEEWKKIGRVPQEHGDDLWHRFTGAQDYFFDNKKKHQDQQRTFQENNYQRKKELYERAEQIKNSGNWNETTDEMITLFEEWKKIGPIPRSYGDKMWEDFNAARKHFFNRKDAYRDQRKQRVERDKEVRAAKAKGLVGELELEIKEEEAKIADFTNGLHDITPGKKAAELKEHLEKLIVECIENIKRLQQKLERAKNDLNVPQQADNEKM